MTTYKDLSPEGCFARDTTVPELTVVFIFESYDKWTQLRQSTGGKRTAMIRSLKCFNRILINYYLVRLLTCIELLADEVKITKFVLPG